MRQEAYFDEAETTVGDDGVRREPLGSPVEWTEEESYFFRLSKYQDQLLAHYAAHPDFILPPERRNEIVSFVSRGLQDLSISRGTLDWGVPVPDSPAGASDAHSHPRNSKHVMYVWTDALTNYVTATGVLNKGDNPRKKFWPASVHIIGKDITRFHAVYWPAFLMSAGIALPERVFSHGFLNNRGEKMSKSVGNVVDPFSLVQTYGRDAVRYFFMRETAFGSDGSYSHEAIINRINADLANDLGNLAQRSLSIIAKNCDGKVPTPGPMTEADLAILAQADALHAASRAAMDKQNIKGWLDAVWGVVADCNRYFAGEEPWAKTKTDPARRDTILYVTAEVVRQVAILAQPVMPESCGKLLDLLGQTADQRAFKSLGAHHRLRAGLALPAPSGVFPRYIDPEEEAKRAGQPKPQKGGKKKEGS